jgi:hypothetical protein
MLNIPTVGTAVGGGHGVSNIGMGLMLYIATCRVRGCAQEGYFVKIFFNDLSMFSLAFEACQDLSIS